MAIKNGRVTLALINQKIDNINVDVKEIKNTINGFEDQPGLKGRIQTLEDHDKNTRWYFRTIWAAICASGIGFYIKG